MDRIRWTRLNRRIGTMILDAVYESDCRRFSIHQLWHGRKVRGYSLSICDRLAPEGLREHDTLAAAKQAARGLAEAGLVEAR
jgi:hypothetical protein